MGERFTQLKSDTGAWRGGLLSGVPSDSVRYFSNAGGGRTVVGYGQNIVVGTQVLPFEK